jgi:hypothetical protein
MKNDATMRTSGIGAASDSLGAPSASMGARLPGWGCFGGTGAKEICASCASVAIICAAKPSLS